MRDYSSFILGLPRFSPEPWFEPELDQSPVQGSTSMLNRTISPVRGSRGVENLANLFERVRIIPNLTELGKEYGPEYLQNSQLGVLRGRFNLFSNVEKVSRIKLQPLALALESLQTKYKHYI